MMRVTIELHPTSGATKRELYVVELENMSPLSDPLASYTVRLKGEGINGWMRTRIPSFRRNRGGLRLTRIAIEALEALLPSEMFQQ